MSRDGQSHDRVTERFYRMVGELGGKINRDGKRARWELGHGKRSRMIAALQRLGDVQSTGQCYDEATLLTLMDLRYPRRTRWLINTNRVVRTFLSYTYQEIHTVDSIPIESVQDTPTVLG
jgi:hypothetical protein